MIERTWCPILKDWCNKTSPKCGDCEVPPGRLREDLKKYVASGKVEITAKGNSYTARAKVTKGNGGPAWSYYIRIKEGELESFII